MRGLSAIGGPGITSVLHEERGGYANNMASVRGLAAKAQGAASGSSKVCG